MPLFCSCSVGLHVPFQVEDPDIIVSMRLPREVEQDCEDLHDLCDWYARPGETGACSRHWCGAGIGVGVVALLVYPVDLDVHLRVYSFADICEGAHHTTWHRL